MEQFELEIYSNPKRKSEVCSKGYCVETLGDVNSGIFMMTKSGIMIIISFQVSKEYNPVFSRKLVILSKTMV